MKDSRKLKRLLDVQRHLESMAEVELARLSEERAEIEEKIESAIDAIGSMEPVHVGLKAQYAQQFTRLSVQEKLVQARQEVQEKMVMREKAKADRLESNFRGLLSSEEREHADNEILDLVEITLATGSQASSKLDG